MDDLTPAFPPQKTTTKTKTQSGPVPPVMGTMPHLKFLKLASNALTGTLPASLGGLESIMYLNLADNRLVRALI